MLKRGLSTIALLIWAGAPFAQDAQMGAERFLTYCATCHGIDATGQGPMAGVLVIKPVDLTKLAANNNGTFPMARVAARQTQARQLNTAADDAVRAAAIVETISKAPTHAPTSGWKPRSRT